MARQNTIPKTNGPFLTTVTHRTLMKKLGKEKRKEEKGKSKGKHQTKVKTFSN